MIRHLRIFLLVLQISLVSACQDTIETKCPDYNCAIKKGIIDQGWIPKEILSESMTDIYQKTDLDLNKCIFAYTLNQTDFDNLMLKIKKIDVKNVAIDFSLPKWWKTNVVELEHYSFSDNSHSKFVFLAIDKAQNRIYGWRE